MAGQTAVSSQRVKITTKVLKKPTFSQMSVDTHVSSCSSEVLVFFVGNVSIIGWIYVLLGKPKVNNVYDVLFAIRMTTNKKILWFNVTIDEIF